MSSTRGIGISPAVVVITLITPLGVLIHSYIPVVAINFGNANGRLGRSGEIINRVTLQCY